MQTLVNVVDELIEKGGSDWCVRLVNPRQGASSRRTVKGERLLEAMQVKILITSLPLLAELWTLQLQCDLCNVKEEMFSWRCVLISIWTLSAASVREGPRSHREIRSQEDVSYRIDQTIYAHSLWLAHAAFSQRPSIFRLCFPSLHVARCLEDQ